MPELPEVETIAGDLRQVLPGKVIAETVVLRESPIRFPAAAAFVARTTGRQITGVDRVGKYLLLCTEPDERLLFHLGMSGHLTISEAGSARAPHTHAIFRLTDGRELRFDDARRFGRIAYGSLDELTGSGALPTLGPDAVSEELDTRYLERRMACTKRPVKGFLLDQAEVAGLGNIYTDELCFRSGILPGRRADSLLTKDVERLLSAIRSVLKEAVANRGSSIDEFRDVWNAKGKQQERLLVYGKGGMPCPACGTVLSHAVIAGRTSTYCTTCQS